MAFIDWSDDFSVGNADMDAQHKRLVAVINGLYELLQNKGAADFGAQVRGLMGDLIRFIQDHFADEERLLAESDYPIETLLEHRREHNRLIEETAELQARIAIDDYEGAALMLPFLYGDWLIRHICETDKAYLPYVSK